MDFDDLSPKVAPIERGERSMDAHTNQDRRLHPLIHGVGSLTFPTPTTPFGMSRVGQPIPASHTEVKIRKTEG